VDLRFLSKTLILEIRMQDSKPKRKDLSAAGAEKKRQDDEAVESTLQGDQSPSRQGPRSVLPGPPLPPDRQAEIRARQGGTTSENRPSPQTENPKKEDADR